MACSAPPTSRYDQSASRCGPGNLLNRAKGDGWVNPDGERVTLVPDGLAGTGRASQAQGRVRPWLVTAVATAAVAVLLCVRNRFLFTTRLYEDADMGANSILVEQARHFTLLVGNYSRDHFHHPGPAYMYVKAAGESLFCAWRN